MQIEYVRGCENAIADALSRLDSVSIDAEVPAELARGVPSDACPVAEVDRFDARTDWIAQQSADPTIVGVIQLLNANARADVDELKANPALKTFADVWPQFVIDNALLKHCNERAISTRIVVLVILREDVFCALHEPAHHGYEATLRRFAQPFWWPRIRGDVSAFVKSCEVCERDRNSNPLLRAPLGHLPADKPIGTLYIDIVAGQGSISLGPSPKSILTMIDGLSGWAEAIPIADQSASTCARAVYAEWIARYGVPEQLHSNRGTQFESELFAELCATFEVDKTRTTTYRPQANGKCERFNRTLVAMLRRAVKSRSYDWESLLAPVLQSYRSTVSEATGFTPFRLAFGREMLLPIDLGLPLPEPTRDVRTFDADLSEDLEWSYKVAREIIGHGHKRAESRYNERVVEHAYQPGCLVRVLQHERNRNTPSKLDTVLWPVRSTGSPRPAPHSARARHATRFHCESRHCPSLDDVARSLTASPRYTRFPPSYITARRTPASSPRSVAACPSATSTSAARSAPSTSCPSLCGASAPSAHSSNESAGKTTCYS